jgi:isoquinoline 1-oxidoreductase beta subunit
MDAGNVFVHTAFLGGAFGGGGSGNTPVTRQATHLSSELGRPVKVVWSREQDVMHDSARAWTAVRFTAAIGSDGLPSAWHTRISSPRPAGAGWYYPKFDIANMAYQVLNRHHEAIQVADHIPTATHRAPGTNQNDFMVDGFIDEVALAGGWDPLEWRLKLAEGLPSETLVLSTLKEKTGFTTDLPRGTGMGISAGWDHGTFCGACATVSVSRRGQLWIENIVHVIDCGNIINPLNCKEQSEGSSIYELSHAWMGGLEMRNGRFVNDNFDTYKLLRMENSYPHDMILALSGGDMWGGMGEPSGPPTPGAVANAVFFATGKRMRTTPFKHHDLSWS